MHIDRLRTLCENYIARNLDKYARKYTKILTKDLIHSIINFRIKCIFLNGTVGGKIFLGAFHLYDVDIVEKICKECKGVSVIEVELDPDKTRDQVMICQYMTKPGSSSWEITNNFQLFDDRKIIKMRPVRVCPSKISIREQDLWFRIGDKKYYENFLKYKS